jgi:hypothetical protein
VVWVADPNGVIGVRPVNGLSAPACSPRGTPASGNVPRCAQPWTGILHPHRYDRACECWPPMRRGPEASDGVMRQFRVRADLADKIGDRSAVLARTDAANHRREGR